MAKKAEVRLSKYRSEKESCLLVSIVPYWLMHAWSYNMLKPCSQMVTSSCLPMMWELDSGISASSKCHHGFSLVLCTRYTRLGLGSCIIITPWWVGQPCGFYAPDILVPVIHMQASWFLTENLHGGSTNYKTTPEPLANKLKAQSFDQLTVVY